MQKSNTAEKMYFLGAEEVLDTSHQETPVRPSNSQNNNSNQPEEPLITGGSSENIHDAPAARELCRTPLGSQLHSLASLIANVTESFSTAIYRARADQVLELAAVHTLSRNFLYEARIAFGAGLVGWTAEHALRISVCPFENDATTLLYYATDQNLKSFIAVPILSSSNELLGVIACDSRKSYAFAKITEKILMDCAKQAATLLELHKQLGLQRFDEPVEASAVEAFIQDLRAATSEEELLKRAAEIPQALIARDALFVVTSDTDEMRGTVYTGRDKTSPTGHRLLETICLHKKILCSDRSIQVPPLDDIQKRSFLSVPFQCLNRDAGSFNALSRPGQSFEARGIEALELAAKVVSARLEHLRLRERHYTSRDTVGLRPWASFRRRADQYLQQAAAQREPLSLIRFHCSNMLEIERAGGVSVSAELLQQVMRLIDQVKPSGSIAGYLHGAHVLLLLPTAEVEQTRRRLFRLLDRMSMPSVMQDGLAHNEAVGTLLVQGLREVVADVPANGTTIDELVRHTISLLAPRQQQQQLTSKEEVSHAVRW